MKLLLPQPLVERRKKAILIHTGHTRDQTSSYLTPPEIRVK